MSAPTIEDVYFDEADGNLFLVPEPRLRADALRQSVLPRLHVMMHHCLALIREIYGVEALEDSILSQTPNFRTKRDRELDHLYLSAMVSLGGQRNKAKWRGALRKDGRQAQILPFTYGLQIDSAGLCIYFQSQWLKGVGPEFYGQVFDFLLDYESAVSCLSRMALLTVSHAWPDTGPVSNWDWLLELLFDNELYRLDFGSDPLYYPIPSERLDPVCHRFAFFYPIYDTYIQIAKGAPHRFEMLIESLNQWFLAPRQVGEAPPTQAPPEEATVERARSLAEQQVRVMPSIRWQVFQRDGFRCVHCGREPERDNVVLHLDHVVPRSRGGSDQMDNLQTLCHLCNLGKSNRLETPSPG